MNKTAYMLGFGSALLSTLLLLTFTGCFIALVAANPDLPTAWTTLPDYLTNTQQNNQTLKHIAQLCMLLFCPLLVVMVNSLHSTASATNQYWSRISFGFATGFCVLTATMYFVQLTTVRLATQNGYTAGIEQFIQFYPHAGILSVGMLGMTLFLGLASLFIMPLFRESRHEQAIRIFLFLNGICCLTGGVAYGLDAVWLIHLTMNLGMGGSLMVLMVLLAIYFFKRWQLEK